MVPGVVSHHVAELANKKDGDWATVGGMIAECKRIRTKKGDPMMFATLDDLEGAVEILVFGKALEAYGGELGVDQVVVVHGRVDHKDATKTCVIAQEVESARVAAKAAALPPEPFSVSVDATLLQATVIEELKELLERFPGKAEFVLEMRTSAGDRRLRFGGGYRVDPSVGLRASLGELLGEAAVLAA